MQEAGAVVYWLLLLVAWLAIPFGVPGALIMLALSLLYGWQTGFREPTGHALIWIAAVTLPAEAADQLLGIWAARHYGATFRGILGGVAGGIAGGLLLSPVLPIVGTIAGALGGGFAGTYVVEWMVQHDPRRALRAAWGGFIGRIAGIVLKLAAGGWVLYITWHALFRQAGGP